MTTTTTTTTTTSTTTSGPSGFQWTTQNIALISLGGSVAVLLILAVVYACCSKHCCTRKHRRVNPEKSLQVIPEGPPQRQTWDFLTEQHLRSLALSSTFRGTLNTFQDGWAEKTTKSRRFAEKVDEKPILIETDPEASSIISADRKMRADYHLQFPTDREDTPYVNAINTPYVNATEVRKNNWRIIDEVAKERNSNPTVQTRWGNERPSIQATGAVQLEPAQEVSSRPRRPEEAMQSGISTGPLEQQMINNPKINRKDVVPQPALCGDERKVIVKREYTVEDQEHHFGDAKHSRASKTAIAQNTAQGIASRGHTQDRQAEPRQQIRDREVSPRDINKRPGTDSTHAPEAPQKKERDMPITRRENTSEEKELVQIVVEREPGLSESRQAGKPISTDGDVTEGDQGETRGSRKKKKKKKRHRENHHQGQHSPREWQGSGTHPYMNLPPAVIKETSDLMKLPQSSISTMPSPSAMSDTADKGLAGGFKSYPDQ